MLSQAGASAVLRVSKGFRGSTVTEHQSVPADARRTAEGPPAVPRLRPLRCDVCGDRDCLTNPVLAVGSERVVTVLCEACRALGLRPRFARRLRRAQ
jgi:hypothetical protein